MYYETHVLVLYECYTDCCVPSPNVTVFFHNFVNTLVQAYGTTEANLVLIWLSIDPLPTLWKSTCRGHVYMSVCLSFCLSVCLSVCLSQINLVRPSNVQK